MASIKTVLDLDITKFERGVDVGSRRFMTAFGPGGEASRGADKMVGDFERVLHRGFGPGEILKTAMSGFLGFASVAMVVDKVREYYQGIAESARRIADENLRGAKALERIKDLFRSDPQKLENLRGQFREKLGEYRKTNAYILGGVDNQEDREKAARLQADLKENLASQAELRKKIRDANTEERRKAADIDQTAAKEREQREYAKRSLDEQLFHQELREMNARTQVDLARDPVGKATARLEIEKAITEQTRLRAEIQKESDEEWGKELAEIERRQRVIADLVNDEAKASKAVMAAGNQLQADRDERTKYSLRGAIEGKEGTATERARARQIDALERRGRRALNTGGEFRDELGNIVSADRYATGLMDRAEAMRRLSPNMRESDRNQHSASEKTLQEAAATLKDIKSQLTVARGL